MYYDYNNEKPENKATKKTVIKVDYYVDDDNTYSKVKENNNAHPMKNEETYTTYDKAVQELNNHIDKVFDDSTTNNNAEKILNKKVEEKKKEDSEFEEKAKATVKKIKKVMNPDTEEKEVILNPLGNAWFDKVFTDDATIIEMTQEIKKRMKKYTLYNKIREFLLNTDFIPAFIWFMENSYNKVSFRNHNKRRVYQIYKDLIKGSNIYAICIKDEDKRSKQFDCEFIINGSNKAMTDFYANRKAKFAKILTKYIISSNTAPYILDLMGYDNNSIDWDNYNAVPTSTSTIRSMYRSERYVKTLEKVCFGKDFN